MFMFQHQKYKIDVWTQHLKSIISRLTFYERVPLIRGQTHYNVSSFAFTPPRLVHTESSSTREHEDEIKVKLGTASLESREKDFHKLIKNTQYYALTRTRHLQCLHVLYLRTLLFPTASTIVAEIRDAGKDMSPGGEKVTNNHKQYSYSHFKNY